MNRTFNIYCDESCHLLNDGQDIMVLGGITCPFEQVRIINQQIKRIKLKHGLKPDLEIKWTKVSNGKIEFYQDLLNFFFNNAYLSFRGVIATNKRYLNHDVFHQTHDIWYYKMYYLLLRHIIHIGDQYRIYIDIKDSRGIYKVNKLQEVLNRSLYDFYNETVERIQIVRSEEIEILQLADLLIGAVSYANRLLDTSLAKLQLADCIRRMSGINLNYSTPLYESKFNLFVWHPREVR